MNELKLISSEDLVKELCSRYDSCLICSIENDGDKGNGYRITHSGCTPAVFGLATYALKYAKDELMSTLDPILTMFSSEDFEEAGDDD